MKLYTIFIISAIFLVINFNIADAADIMDGNIEHDNRPRKNRRYDDLDDDFSSNGGGGNVIRGNNIHNKVQTSIRTEYDDGKGKNVYKYNYNSDGRNVLNNDNKDKIKSSKVTGSESKEEKKVDVLMTPKELGLWQKFKNFFG